jgi:hypothetical protein
MTKREYPKVGHIFGNWTVIGEKKSIRNNTTGTHIRFPCQCACGNIKDVKYSSLKNGESTSCGCKENRSRGRNILLFNRNDEIIVDGVTFKVHDSELFAVSKCGSVYGKKGTILKPKSQGHYLIVSYQIYVDGKIKTRNKYVHRLVAETWLDNPLEKECVNHKDGNKLNNSASNLEWVTFSENHRHAIDTGLLWNLPEQGERGFRRKCEQVSVHPKRN